MKQCYQCSLIRDESEFNKDKNRKDGLQVLCRSCSKEFYKANRAKMISAAQRWQADNFERSRAKIKEWMTANPERVKSNVSRWQKENPGRMNAIVAKRRAAKLKATPAWAKTWIEKIKIEEIYLLSETRSIVTGIKHHVDHIVALQNKKACGLHCFANLQILEGSENMSKGNR